MYTLVDRAVFFLILASFCLHVYVVEYFCMPRQDRVRCKLIYRMRWQIVQNQLYIYIHTYVYTCVSKELRVCLYLFDISSIVYAFKREREKKNRRNKTTSRRTHLYRFCSTSWSIIMHACNLYCHIHSLTLCICWIQSWFKKKYTVVGIMWISLSLSLFFSPLFWALTRLTRRKITKKYAFFILIKKN